jgi:hypothetical protein
MSNGADTSRTAAANGDPQLSVILATDTYETIRGVLERLRRQTVRERLEVVLVVPEAARANLERVNGHEFGALRAVECGTISPMSRPRFAGIRAATAPLVFIGETHSFPHPGWAQALIAADDGRWDALTPAFGNANPRGVISWAGFLSDYGPWSAGLPAGEVADTPLYNTAYRRTALLELGDRLEPMLSYGDELRVAFRTRGHRSYFAADARIDHLNLTHLADWCRERLCGGILVGAHRSELWSRRRRLAYAIGSPLIPAVLCWRLWRVLRRAPVARQRPWGTAALIVLGMIVRAAGELIGYAYGAGARVEAQADEYEVHKVAYATKN